jgi:hypothetical protein
MSTADNYFMASSGACADHCPFLNRHDSRCGEHMSLAGLDHAFNYCFGRYQGCPVYFQMLIERRTRRGEMNSNGNANGHAHGIVQLTIGRDALRLHANHAKAATSAPAHANAA